MKLSICEPAERVAPRPTRVTGFIQTAHDVERDNVFEGVARPPCRVAKVGPTTKVLEPWRAQALLDRRFKATRVAWALDARLFPGIQLNPGVGLPTWKAAQAIDGLLAGEPFYVEAVTGLLTKAKGAVLALPGDMRALVVRESYVASEAIEIGKRYLFSELDEAEELEVSPSDEWSVAAREEGHIEDAEDPAV